MAEPKGRTVNVDNINQNMKNCRYDGECCHFTCFLLSLLPFLEATWTFPAHLIVRLFFTRRFYVD